MFTVKKPYYGLPYMYIISILIYLCADLTAQRPITKSAQVIHIQRKYKKQGY
jgi:hypothetical protein